MKLESASFLKKRSKKLLLIEGVYTGRASAQLVGELALGHTVPMSVGTDPSVEPARGLRCVLMCIHHLSTVDPPMVPVQVAILRAHTPIVELQE